MNRYYWLLGDKLPLPFHAYSISFQSARGVCSFVLIHKLQHSKASCKMNGHKRGRIWVPVFHQCWNVNWESLLVFAVRKLGCVRWHLPNTRCIVWKLNIHVLWGNKAAVTPATQYCHRSLFSPFWRKQESRCTSHEGWKRQKWVEGTVAPLSLNVSVTRSQVGCWFQRAGGVDW